MVFVKGDSMKNSTALKTTLLATGIALFTGITAFTVAPVTTPVRAVTLSQPQDEDPRQFILELINEHRATRNLPALKLMDELNDEAEKHSQHMASGAVKFGHTGFNDRYNRISKKIAGMNGLAENVAYGDVSLEEIVEGWLNSIGHKKNIEGEFNYTGSGIGQRRGCVFFYTQISLKKN